MHNWKSLHIKKLDTYLYFRWIIDLNIKGKSRKLLKDKIGKYYNLWAGKDFVKGHKFINWGYIKIKDLHSSKDTIKRMKGCLSGSVG